jgi:hypothetical protein
MKMDGPMSWMLRCVIFGRQHIPMNNFLIYMELMSSIIDVDNSNFEEEIDQQVWWDSIIEEYKYIIMNDVW